MIADLYLMWVVTKASNCSFINKLKSIYHEFPKEGFEVEAILISIKT